MDETLERLLKRGVAQIEKEGDLRHLLADGNKGQPLRIKLGVDPSHYELTIGHAVVFRKLRQFQQLGHKAVVVIGDWTARLGDPSGREHARQPLSAEQVKANAETYLAQFFKIVDPQQTEVRWQSEWYDGFSLGDSLKLLSYKTVAQMLERDDFLQRYKGGREISLSEFMYPLLQGYDSVMLQSDVELGGTDQTFNLLVGRELQPLFGQVPQQILTVPLIVGLDGQMKMGKSLKNYIAMSAPASDMYGKLMSLPDHTMMSYFEALTDVPQGELTEYARKMAEGPLNPRDVKLCMAREIVTGFHAASVAQEAEGDFIRQFSERQAPTDMPRLQLAAGHLSAFEIVKRFFGDTKSNSEIRRLFEQGAIECNGSKIAQGEQLVEVQQGDEWRVGRRAWFRVEAK